MPAQRTSPTIAHNWAFLTRARLVPWLESAYLVAEPEPCPPCKSASRVYGLESVPLMPIDGCLKKDGCGCWLAALLPSPASVPRTNQERVGVAPAISSRGDRWLESTREVQP